MELGLKVLAAVVLMIYIASIFCSAGPDILARRYNMSRFHSHSSNTKHPS